MSEYRANITYFVPRHFGQQIDGTIASAGEMLRIGGIVAVAYVRSEKILDVGEGGSFDGRIYFVSKMEEMGRLEPGMEVDIVAPAVDGEMKVIGRCVIVGKIS